MMHSAAPMMSGEEVTAFVLEVFPQSVEHGWKVERLDADGIAVSMAIGEQHLRPGGTVSGPAMFALADVTAYLLVLSNVGREALAVTTNVSINFLNKPAGDLIAHGRLIKLGKRLAVCEIHIHNVTGEAMVAQASVTYSIPPRV